MNMHSQRSICILAVTNEEVLAKFTSHIVLAIVMLISCLRLRVDCPNIRITNILVSTVS